MFGLFKRLLGKDPNKSSLPSSSAGHSRPLSSSAGTLSSSQNVSTHTSSMTPRTVTSSNSGPQEPELFWPKRSVRWDNKYDVYICHSERDLPFAKEMLYFLEGLPEQLRCFLPLRDMDAGGAMVSEMCHGLGNSHCWVMLLTTWFLDDSWCRYQMHQALMKAPGGEGRFIPLMIDLPRSRYPVELSFLCYIRGTSGDHQVFAQLRKCILMCKYAPPRGTPRTKTTPLTCYREGGLRVMISPPRSSIKSRHRPQPKSEARTAETKETISNLADCSTFSTFSFRVSISACPMVRVGISACLWVWVSISAFPIIRVSISAFPMVRVSISAFPMVRVSISSCLMVS
uniref:TIR domain-containing protein n=1 Tax=Leptobrachium leishanense TaxID=445787 RepID=A0A8C5R088_9ANUR